MVSLTDLVNKDLFLRVGTIRVMNEEQRMPYLKAINKLTEEQRRAFRDEFIDLCYDKDVCRLCGVRYSDLEGDVQALMILAYSLFIEKRLNSKS